MPRYRLRFVAVSVLMLLQGCATGETTVAQQHGKPTVVPIGALMITVPDADTVLFAPGVIHDENVRNTYGHTPLFAINTNSGKVVPLGNAGFGVLRAVALPGQEKAVFGYMTPGGSGVRLYVSGAHSLINISPPGPRVWKAGDETGYAPLVPSQDGTRAAGIKVTYNWDGFDETKGMPESMPEKVPHLIWIDVKNRKVAPIDLKDALPLIWDRDNRTLFCATAKGILACDVEAGTVEQESERTDVATAFWSEALDGRVVWAGGNGRPALEFTGDSFATRRVIAQLPPGISSYAVSPDGALLVYGQEASGRFGLIDLQSGQVTPMPGVSGSMEPAWVDNDRIAIADPPGIIRLYNTRGKELKSIRIEGLADLEAAK